MRARTRLAIALAVLALAPLGALLGAQPRGTLIGMVRDAVTRAPVRAAQVDGAGATATTADDGTFVLSIAAGPVLIYVRRLGYAPVAFSLVVPVSDTARVTVALEPAARALDTVVVSAAVDASSARLAGFESRRHGGRGVFITREEIERRRPVAVSDLLRRISSVTVMDSLGAKLAVSSRGRKMSRNALHVPCVMRVGVDGQVKEWGFSLDAVSPGEVHGIEVFSGPASIPAEFGGARIDAFCGLVMLWTRAR